MQEFDRIAADITHFCVAEQFLTDLLGTLGLPSESGDDV
ncbi:MAG: hypothetical protein JWP34_1230 [Massilia sp.]|jgi:hypothetical protein|nr:hypothetical protein [Massilia sp.]